MTDAAADALARCLCAFPPETVKLVIELAERNRYAHDNAIAPAPQLERDSFQDGNGGRHAAAGGNYHGEQSFDLDQAVHPRVLRGRSPRGGRVDPENEPTRNYPEQTQAG